MADMLSIARNAHRKKHKPKLGTGARFHQLEGQLAAKGANNPAALAAYIGRKKYGASRFAALSHHK